jgi:thiamine-phosphate diphosphorylase/hydroxyethylthiazole kinase
MFQFLKIARASNDLCKKYGVPLIVNDRVDVALAIGAAGVHVGQTDMPLPLARTLLPAQCIIGVSCNNATQAEQAIKDGADYVGIGACYRTSTKTLTEPTLGPRGIAEILSVLDSTNIKAVAIGKRSGRKTSLKLAE